MIQELPSTEEMYQAVLDKDTRYEGVFVLGVKTTGIFCRPGCPARNPNPENIEYFRTAKEALDAGYRPCHRCKPMQPAGKNPVWVKRILDEVDKDPSRRWTDAELEQLSVNPNRLRRWFKKHHGMTFQTYLRLRRLGLALGRIQHGDDMTQTAFEHGYESLSGFRDAIKKMTGLTPKNGDRATVVYVNRISTPLGPMIAGTTDEALCLLEFVDRRMLETQLKRLTKRLNCTFVPGSNAITEKASKQLDEYFEGKRKDFDLPLVTPGTEFQNSVWKQLRTIPYGQTRSYEEQATAINNPKAVRAVARSNGDNRIAIIIPYHRVIAKDGTLCGYGGGLWRKKYLLELEEKYSE